MIQSLKRNNSTAVILLMAVLMITSMMAGCASMNKLVKSPSINTDALFACAMDIEKAIQAGNREPELRDREGVIVNISSVKQAIRSRAARKDILNDFMATGFAWERKNALLYTVFSKDYKKSTNATARTRHAQILMEENADRWTLYESIKTANKLGRGSLTQIQETFFKAQVVSMPKGFSYEGEKGESVVK